MSLMSLMSLTSLMSMTIGRITGWPDGMWTRSRA
jgi:hypothetical protein